jgi:ATP-dependent protease ClpP protease subunit
MATIRIDGPIDAALAARVLEEIADTEWGNPLTVLIGSPGGNTDAALRLAARLRSYSGPTIAYVQEFADSAAVAIFSACRTRMVAPGATFQLHETEIHRSYLAGRMTARALRAAASRLDQTDSQVRATIASNIGCTVATLEELERAETLLDAAGAARCGLATVIVGDPSLTAVAATMRMVFAARAERPERALPMVWQRHELDQLAAIAGRPIGINPRVLRASLAAMR